VFSMRYELRLSKAINIVHISTTRQTVGSTLTRQINASYDTNKETSDEIGRGEEQEY